MSRMDRYKILPTLSEDSPQHGLMLAAYRDVGNDYAVDKGQLAKELKALQGFFLSSCRARSRLRRSSKRFVFDWQFPHVGEWVRAKN